MVKTTKLKSAVLGDWSDKWMRDREGVEEERKEEREEGQHDSKDLIFKGNHPIQRGEQRAMEVWSGWEMMTMAQGIQNLPGGRSLIIPSLPIPTTTRMPWLLFTPKSMILPVCACRGYTIQFCKEWGRKKQIHVLMDISLTTIPCRECKQWGAGWKANLKINTHYHPRQNCTQPTTHQSRLWEGREESEESTGEEPPVWAREGGWRRCWPHWTWQDVRPHSGCYTREGLWGGSWPGVWEEISEHKHWSKSAPAAWSPEGEITQLGCGRR